MKVTTEVPEEYFEFYVHGTVRLINTSHININDMQLFYSLYLELEL